MMTMRAARERSESGADAATELEAVLARRVSLRRRVVTVGVVVAALCALLIGAWRVSGASSGQPSAPPLRATVVAEVDGNVSGGTVVVDGRTYPGIFTVLTTLGRGTHTFALQASPLPTISCQASWPPNPAHDTCHNSTGGSSFDPSDSTHLHIALFLRPANLPAAQQAAMREALLTGLAAESDSYIARVAVGQHYASRLAASGLPITTIATVPLDAHLLVSALVSAASPCANLRCVTPAPVHFSVGSTLAIVIAMPIHLGWAFATLAGAPSSQYIYPWAQTLELALAPQPDGTWRVFDGAIGADVASPVEQVAVLQCSTGVQFVGSISPGNSLTSALINQGQASMLTPVQVARGCLLQGFVPSLSAHAYLLIRFGSLLAANAAAHALIPDLPGATSAEIAAAYLAG